MERPVIPTDTTGRKGRARSYPPDFKGFITTQVMCRVFLAFDPEISIIDLANAR